jgi:2-oxoglutarate ferredoxin oxidoreductase subunit alpha
MNEVSVLIGGKAGDGINSAGLIVAQLLNHLSYRIYLYFDYPSLIRGGHNFAIIRGLEWDVGACRNSVDLVLALNEETLERHKEKYTDKTVIIANKDLVKNSDHGIPVKAILADENAPGIMGNSALIGGFAKTAGIVWEVVDAVFRRHIPKGADQNLAVAKKAFDLFDPVHIIKKCENRPQSLVSGNEAIGLGLVRGGLDAYVSYPMTPSSGILHFLAEQKERFGITVVHPENEIAVDPDGARVCVCRKKVCNRHFRRRILPDDRRALACRNGRTSCGARCFPANRPLNRTPYLYRENRSLVCPP